MKTSRQKDEKAAADKRLLFWSRILVPGNTKIAVVFILTALFHFNAEGIGPIGWEADSLNVAAGTLRAVSDQDICGIVIDPQIQIGRPVLVGGWRSGMIAGREFGIIQEGQSHPLIA